MEPSSAPAQLTRTRHSREESRSRIVAAAERLFETRSYAEVSVGDVMAEAGIGRTIFYRHFDDMADLLMRAGREAVEALYEAQLELAQVRADTTRASIGDALRPAVAVYRRHGSLLRAISEAAIVDQAVADGYERQRRRFDGLVEAAMREAAGSQEPGSPPAMETARALNLMNEAYLVDAFGREPRVSEEVAVETLTGIWAGSFEAP